MNAIDNTTRACSIGFLVWLHGFYGNQIEQTYDDMAREFKQCSRGTVRHYLHELRNAGYITIKRRGKVSQTFIIDPEKYNRLTQA